MNYGERASLGAFTRLQYSLVGFLVGYKRKTRDRVHNHNMDVSVVYHL